MSQNSDLHKRQEDAAHLMAEGRFNLCEIASACGIDRRTLFRWRGQPKFAAKVLKMIEQLNAEAMERGITRRAYRINQLANMESALRQVQEERAKDPSMANVPGGRTGIVVRRPVLAGGKIIDYEYEVDCASIAALRDICAQVAKEFGHWTKLRTIEATVSHGAADDAARCTDEELQQEFRDLVKRLAPLLTTGETVVA